jgi:hypothetical protein
MGWYYNIAENMYMNGMRENHVEVYMSPWKNKIKISYKCHPNKSFITTVLEFIKWAK